MNFDFNSQPTPKDYKHEYLLMFLGMLYTYLLSILASLNAVHCISSLINFISNMVFGTFLTFKNKDYI